MGLEGHVGKDGKQSEKATLALLIGERLRQRGVLEGTRTLAPRLCDSLT